MFSAPFNDMPSCLSHQSIQEAIHRRYIRGFLYLVANDFLRAIWPPVKSRKCANAQMFASGKIAVDVSKIGQCSIDVLLRLQGGGRFGRHAMEGPFSDADFAEHIKKIEPSIFGYVDGHHGNGNSVSASCVG